MSTTINTPVSLKPKQVEARYGIPTGSLSNMRWRGDGPRYVKVGRGVLYFAADVEAWLMSQAVDPIEAA